MRKTLAIIKNELSTTLGRPSYLIITFGLPILGVLSFVILGLIRGQPGELDLSETGSNETSELSMEGYVDQANLLKTLPPDLPEDILIPFANEMEAAQALEAGEITAYYIIPENYLETGDFIYIRPDYSPFSSDDQDWMIRWALLFNITGGDPELASYVWHPMNLTDRNLSAEAEATGEEDACLTPGYGCESHFLISMLPLAVLILFFVFISASAGLLLRSVSSEKQNRTMETVLLSVHPRTMMVGKIVGLGIVAILQVMLWLSSIFIILRIGDDTLNLPEGFSIPASILIWGLLLFLTGYLIYASLMAGLGALVPDIKAASQASMVVLLPLLSGYIISVMPPVQEHPHGLLATILSIFPLTAPPVMMMRLTVGNVPFWQPALTIILSIITGILVIRLVAGMFRAQTILSGQPFSPKRYFSLLLGRT